MKYSGKESNFVVQLATKLNLLNHLFLRCKRSDLSILDAYFDDVYPRFSSYHNSSKHKSESSNTTEWDTNIWERIELVRSRRNHSLGFCSKTYLKFYIGSIVLSVPEWLYKNGRNQHLVRVSESFVFIIIEQLIRFYIVSLLVKSNVISNSSKHPSQSTLAWQMASWNLS